MYYRSMGAMNISFDLASMKAQALALPQDQQENFWKQATSEQRLGFLRGLTDEEKGSFLVSWDLLTDEELDILVPTAPVVPEASVPAVSSAVAPTVATTEKSGLMTILLVLGGVFLLFKILKKK